VGGTEEREVDIRVITATNKDLSKMVEEGLFRRDLLYRINTIRISMPPLRERRDDIVPLFYFYLEHYAGMRNIENKRLSPDLTELLMNYNWPGNIRELKNVAEVLVTMSGKNKAIKPEHLPIEVTQADYTGLSAGHFERGENPRYALKAIEKQITIKTLEMAKWNKTAASRELGISRTTLNRRIDEFSIHKESL
jgi:transcriptional regulator with PAS, ATPase and Fis domain